MTSNDYYNFLERVLERYETGELSEEEATQMVNDAVIDEWMADPRPVNRPADILKEIEAHTNSGKPLVRLEPLIEDCDDLTGEPDEQTDSLN